ncbi:AcrR family transcriptional regulator [Novosphingobium chloroacetimidivorans]|uniref:AcrR family transcriptional regulator n=1 Tax=Novosphingobium chloroacetimidivorans TaxID=1428314 RepID=A0A7W7KAD4_9SPHN|nr:TetR/AcrR family transcriptional regulator [Novosphingobium chloroacetimidivorans]MBB4858639.1 AcrR family transcriptional regulator [Novosphingobium chloroacetimidivorans]
MKSSDADAPRARGGGRRRSETVRQSILTAALHLLQTEALQSITIEAIAREAGVSKATIYRWWSSKALVVIDAFIENHIGHTPMRHDIHPAEALVRHWRAMAEQYAGWPGQVVGQILAEGQSDPNILREFRQRFHYGRRAVVREVVEQLIRLCPVPGHLQAEELMDMLYAPIYMRLLWGHAPIDDTFIRDYPLAMFKLLGVHFDDDLRVVAPAA